MLRKHQPFNTKNTILVLAILLFAGTGTYLTFGSSASPLPVAAEADAGTLTAPATIGADSAASGGQYVQFGNVPTPPQTAGTIFNNGSLQPVNNSKVTFSGKFQSCNLTASQGVNIPLSATLNGVHYNGAINGTGPCYSIVSGNGAAGHPALFGYHGGGTGDRTQGDYTATLDSASGVPVSNALSAGWDAVYIGETTYNLTAGGTQTVMRPNQLSVDYYKAVFNDLYTSHNVGRGKVYFAGFSAGSSIPLVAACKLSSDVSAIVTESGVMHGPAADALSAGYVPCSKPPNSVSIMFSEASNPTASSPNTWLGYPNYSPAYTVHISPSHKVLDTADIADITSARSNANWTNVVHAAEGWAYWEGCGNNLTTFGQQNRTLNGGAALFWDWTGCQATSSGKPGEIQLYVFMSTGGVNHGSEKNVGIDPSNPAWAFLNTH